jgi:hypothetical protein
VIDHALELEARGVTDQELGNPFATKPIYGVNTAAELLGKAAAVQQPRLAAGQGRELFGEAALELVGEGTRDGGDDAVEGGGGGRPSASAPSTTRWRL